MSDRENKFLENAFKNFRSEQILNSEFNLQVLQRIQLKNENRALLIRFLKIFIPIYLVFISGLITLIIYKGESLYDWFINIIPSIKPWQLFIGGGLLYFHFLRSVLILAFLYLKKHFNFVFSFT